MFSQSTNSRAVVPARTLRTALAILCLGGLLTSNVSAASLYGPGSGSLEENSQARMDYMLHQVILSGTNFGIGLPLLNGFTDVREIVAAQLIVWPLSFGGHLFFSKNRDFTVSQVRVIDNFSAAALSSTYMMPLLWIDDGMDALAGGSWATIATYPLSLAAGYWLGERYNSKPAGFGGQYWGILTHALLGGALGAEWGALSRERGTLENAILPALGFSLGYLEGLVFFSYQNDLPERGFYGLLGGTLGALVGTGVTFLTEEGFDNRLLATSTISLGAVAGYIMTYLLTGDMKATGSSSTLGSGEQPLELLMPGLELSASNEQRWRLAGLRWHY